MRVLLDECVDIRLAASLAPVDVRTVADQGWLGISNGKLLALAAAEFDVFVTVDRNLPFQQHLPKFGITVILLRAKTNRILDLVALVPELVSVIPNAKPGVVTSIGLQQSVRAIVYQLRWAKEEGRMIEIKCLRSTSPHVAQPHRQIPLVSVLAPFQRYRYN